MDHNRNEDITPEDTDLAGVGQDRPRGSDKMAPDRSDSDDERGRDGFKGRAGEPSGGSGH